MLLNLHALEAVLHENAPFVLAFLLAGCVLVYADPNRRIWRQRLGRAWPTYIPALLGVCLYLQVHLEARYIAGFCAVLAIFPFLICNPSGLSKRLRASILVLLLAGTLADLAIHLRSPLRLVLHHADMQSGGQWEIARYLQQSGLKPGDKVASVTTGNDIRCTWAYAAGLHIVADIGNDAFDPQSQQQDFDLFWTDPGHPTGCSPSLPRTRGSSPSSPPSPRHRKTPPGARSPEPAPGSSP